MDLCYRLSASFCKLGLFRLDVGGERCDFSRSKKKVTVATAVGKQLWVSGKLGGVNLCMTFNFYDMQVVAVKYGQILATQHGKEHEKQNPKYTAT